MNIKAIIDSIVPERKENGQIVTTGQVAEVLAANRLHHPLPFKYIEGLAELCGIEELYDVMAKIETLIGWAKHRKAWISTLRRLTQPLPYM